MSTATATATTATTEGMTVIVQKYPEWYAAINSALMLILVVFFIAVICYAMLKRQNVPITQAIEVDSREPHSITITFVPAQVMDKSAMSGGGGNEVINVQVNESTTNAPVTTTTSDNNVPAAAPTA